MATISTPNQFASHNLKAKSGTTLGHVVWHAVSDLRVTEADLKALGAKHGFKDVPELGDPSDAFRRATSAQSKRGEDKTRRYLVRPVCDTADEIVRHVVVERVDKAGQRLAHEALAQLRFVKPTKRMDAVRLVGSSSSPDESAVVDGMMSEATKLFAEYRDSLTGPEVTRWVMRQLNKMSRVTVHPHGHVYFVPDVHGGTVERLAAFVRDLKQYTVDKDAIPQLWSVAVPDTAGQRDMVKAGFVATMTTELQQIGAEVMELQQRAGKPGEAVVAERFDRLSSAIRKANEYKAMLDLQTAEFDATVDLLREQLTALEQASQAPDALAAKAKAEGAMIVVKAETTTISRFGRKVTVRCNREGWSLRSTERLGADGLAQRPEVTTRKDPFAWTARTADADVAMLFVRAALRLPKPTAAQ